jgi:hypothetical protein
VTSVVTPGVDESTAPPSKSGGARRVAMLVARIVFTAAVVGFVTWTTVDQWSEVRATIASLAWQSIVLSTVMVLAGLGAQTLAYQAALRDVGHRVSVRTTGQIYLIGLLGKYVPGSIWTFVLQMELGRRAKLQRPRVIVASLLVVGLGTVAAFLLGLFGLPVLFEIDRAVTIAIFAMVPVALVCAHPKVLTWMINRFLRVVRRAPLDEPISWPAVGLVVMWSSLGWIFFGVHLWLLANASAAPGIGGVFRCVGAIALGITAGIVAFLSPSGLGAREAIIVAALLPYVPLGTATGIALASRLIFTVGELIAAAVAALSGIGEVRAARAAIRARVAHGTPTSGDDLSAAVADPDPAPEPGGR